MESQAAKLASASPSPPGSGLVEVLDEHAELRDLGVQLAEARDLGILSGLLQRLRDLLQSHFAREEADPELRRVLEGAASPSTGAVASLVEEHHALLATLGDLVSRIEAGEDGSRASFEREVASLLKHLARHDARETELFGVHAGAGADPSSTTHSSKALEVNLRRTAVDVVIPPEQAVLLEITSAQYGIHESTRKLLREINHHYVGWAQTLEELHRRAMSDLPRYLADQRAPEAIGVFLSMYAKVAEQARPLPVRETAIRQWFYYLEKIVTESGDVLPRLVPPIKCALSRLGAVFGEEPRHAVASSPRLRHFAEKLLALRGEDRSEEVAERALELLASSLRRVYEHWLAQPDPAEWWREQTGRVPDSGLPDRLAAISHARIERALARIDELSARPDALLVSADALLALPDEARIERSYLDAAGCLDSSADESRNDPMARIQWLIRVLSSEALAAVHERALAEIHHAYRDALTGADPEAVEDLLRGTFAGLRRSSLCSSPAAFDLLSKVGVAVFSSGEPELAQVLIDELLDWDFPGPGFSGFTDEWQVRVDPAHIRATRAFLAMIEEAPELACGVIAALVVHLKLGGVFVADTDLFQKDVTRLLNSGIGSVYHPVKHLLKLFPIYFNDIGAEGELRDVSSRIDEITGRKDPLLHFLRKQCHVECNPQLIAFVDAIGDSWTRGERAPLRPYLPPSLYEELDVEQEPFGNLHRDLSGLLRESGIAALAKLDPEEMDRRLAGLPNARPVDLEKVRLLARLRRLLSEKYELGQGDLLERITARSDVAPETVARLRSALDERRDEEALEILLGLLEQLKQTIVSPERTEGFEDIYRKRHIAVGIPSMYGRYREEKFEALGLSFRMESAASSLFERMISEHDLDVVSRGSLRRAGEWLRLLLRAVRVDGCQARGLATGISMLEQALEARRVSANQYINVFQTISRGVEQLIRIRFLDVYPDVVDRVLRRAPACEGTAGDRSAEDQERILKTSERFLRDLIAESFGLQPLDRLVGRVLQSLVEARQRFDPDTLSRMLGFDAERCCVPIPATEGAAQGTVQLGNKGYLIHRLAQEGLPVPPGFILTTDLFRGWPAFQACAEMRTEVRERIRMQIARLERETGLRFADPTRPLLLSVRSGAAVSMPGILDTFLDVGINERIAEGLAGRSGSPWGAWDAYRRFLQFWGMGHGVPRDRFDELMRLTKSELGVAKKAEISSEAMKEVARRYRRFVEEQGVEIAEDPGDQLERCIELVLESWNAEKARVYRAELQIAEEWGTAVIVQSMVYGNLHERSGTGVALTADSRHSARDVSIQGDFIVQGQGDDVVSGLVETLPISEEQRRAASTRKTRSLEKDFPGIYRALLEHARVLVREQGMFHQELEFTFESDDPADLYILQTRDRTMTKERSVSAFVPSPALDAARLATGIGAGGGALSGRLAHSAGDIERLRREYPEDPVILLRPDTVPDDIPLILRVNGMVTSLGGATSHAAIVAQQLGRTCVVGCRELRVHEQRGCSEFGDRTLSTGEFISISGVDGTIYLGRHPSTEVRRPQFV